MDRLKQFHTWVSSLSPIQQAYTVAGLGISLQYTLSALSYFALLPDVAGVSLTGVMKNSTYMIPGFLAVFFTFYFEGYSGLKRIFRPYLVVLVNPIYWLVASLILVPILYLSLFLNGLLPGGETKSYLMTLPTWEEIKFYSPLFIKVAICDELFWIGFVYPRMLQAGYSPLKASLAIGILWGADYVPFLFTGFFIAQGLNLPALLLGWFSLTPIYIWLYHRTGSAIIILVFNLFMQFLFTAIPILPKVIGDNSGVVMGNLICLLSGFLLWYFAPSGKKEPLPVKQDELIIKAERTV